MLSCIAVSKISWLLCMEIEFGIGWSALGLQCVVALEFVRMRDNDWRQLRRGPCFQVVPIIGDIILFEGMGQLNYNIG